MQITLKYEVMRGNSPNNELCLCKLQPAKASWAADLSKEWVGDPNEVIRMAESYLQTQIGVCVDAVEKCRGRVTVGLRLTRLGDLEVNHVLRAATLWWDNDEQVVKVQTKSLEESTLVADNLMVDACSQA